MASLPRARAVAQRSTGRGCVGTSPPCSIYSSVRISSVKTKSSVSLTRRYEIGLVNQPARSSVCHHRAAGRTEDFVTLDRRTAIITETCKRDGGLGADGGFFEQPAAVN